MGGVVGFSVMFSVIYSSGEFGGSGGSLCSEGSPPYVLYLGSALFGF